MDDWGKFSHEEISDDSGNGNLESVSHEKAIESGSYPLNDSEKPLLDNYRQLNPAGQETEKLLSPPMSLKKKFSLLVCFVL